MTRAGECLGLRMAASRLMEGQGQIRFLSRYFLTPDESLVHGAEIIAGYLEDDRFVAAVETQHLEKEIFTFQVLRVAIATRFSEHADQILLDFVRMIAFDALVGNQDRHLYNWGVVVHPRAAREPRFSPIYDTARGLFWNFAEGSLDRFGTDSALAKYVEEARPLIGWDGQDNVNHFRLVANIAQEEVRCAEVLRAIPTQSALVAIERTIDQEFGRLLSAPRRTLLKRCLRMRFGRFAEVLEGGGIC